MRSLLPELPRSGLRPIRRLIDRVDDQLLWWMAARRRLVAAAARIKRDSDTPMRDPDREAEVHARAQRVGRLLGLPTPSIRQLMDLLINDACEQQRSLRHDPAEFLRSPDPDQIVLAMNTAMLAGTMIDPELHPVMTRFLGLLPPPTRLAPLLRVVPDPLIARALEAALRHVLAAPIRSGSLDLLLGRRIGIEVSDLGLRWVIQIDASSQLQICPSGESAEATVKGSATDLLLLASRREDADTLFFQRRLRLTGDTELGLTARNLLDQLPWDEVPLALRIVLHRFAGVAEAARAAFHQRKHVASEATQPRLDAQTNVS